MKIIGIIMICLISMSVNAKINRYLVEPMFETGETQENICKYLKRFRGQIVAYEDSYWEWDECDYCGTGCPTYSSEEIEWNDLIETFEKEGKYARAIRVEKTGCQFILTGRGSLAPVLDDNGRQKCIKFEKSTYWD